MAGRTKWQDLAHKARPEDLERARRELEAAERLHRSRGAVKKPRQEPRKTD